MPARTSKHPKSARVQPKIVSQARASLHGLPEEQEKSFSLREAIRQLRDPLEAALIRGYSYQELVNMLQQQGIAISVSTLKNYLTSAQRDSRIRISSKLKDESPKYSLEKPSSAVEVFIPSRSEISSYTVGRDFWNAYQESLRAREEVYRRLAES
jgi:hypothetical protein